MEKTDLRDEVKQQAIENFKKGLNCAECVYDALVRTGVLRVPDESRAGATGFGGGIGLAGYTCGALSGAVLANSMEHGRKDPWSVPDEERGSEVSKKYYRRYNRLLHDFEELAGGVLCRDICAVHEDWHSKPRRIMCMKLIGETAALAFDYLQMSQEEAFKLPYGENIGGNE